MKRTCLLTAITTMALMSSVTVAHHSPVLYDQEQQAMITGQIVRYQWANPHVYVWLEDPLSGVTWEIEGGPPAVFTRTGWKRDDLAAGKTVSITGSPGRESGNSIFLMKSMQKNDAMELSLDFMRYIESFNQKDKAVAKQDHSFNGTWATLFTMDTYQQLFFPEKFEWTEKGRVALKSYVDAVDNPTIECVPSQAPGGMTGPSVKSIEVLEDVVLIRDELGSSPRIIHLGKSSHEGVEPTIRGHAIGRWEGNSLVVDSRYFTPRRSNIGVSGLQKHVTERFELNENGSILIYSFVVEDPEYLVKPVEGFVELAHRPDIEFSMTGCDPESARRFVEQGKQ